MSNPVCGLFVTGTDTGVGKTYVSALIARALVAAGHRVGVYKPVASGCELVEGVLVSEDAVQLWQAAGQPGELAQVCPQRFAAPLAPHLAARAEGKKVDAKLLRSGLDYWLKRSDVVIAEGAGGLMSPVSDEDFVADLAAEFGFPLIVVAKNALGTINATLQTLITASTFDNGMNQLSETGLTVAGIVLNQTTANSDDPSIASNRTEIERLAMAPVLAEIKFGDSEFTLPINWEALAKS